MLRAVLVPHSVRPMQVTIQLNEILRHGQPGHQGSSPGVPILTLFLTMAFSGVIFSK